MTKYYKSILKSICTLLFFTTSIVLGQQDGTVVKFTIEGTAETELNKNNSSIKIQELEKRVYNRTIEKLKTKYSLKEIVSIQKKLIVRKNGLNRLKGVKRLSKKEFSKVEGNNLTFKIKCDIAFDDNMLASVVTNNDSKRAVVYLSVGVFKNKKRLGVLKSKKKSSHTFIGKNTQVYLNLDDFENLYFEAINNLK